MNLQNLLSNTSADRSALKPRFNTGEIPTQADFHALIDGSFLLRDDSIYKDADNGLCIKAGTDAAKTALLLYDDFSDPKWTIAIGNGFHIKTGASSLLTVSTRGNLSLLGQIVQEKWKKAVLEEGFKDQNPECVVSTRYYKDKMGRVHIEGLLDLSERESSNTVIFKLPKGYRPSSLLAFNAGSGPGKANHQVFIDKNGSVLILNPSSGEDLQFLLLSGISFRV